MLAEAEDRVNPRLPWVTSRSRTFPSRDLMPDLPPRIRSSTSVAPDPSMKEPLSALLKDKGSKVHHVPPTATVAEAVRLMVQKRIGSVVVMEDGSVVGIFTERDALNRVLDAGRPPSLTRIREVMTPKPVVATPEVTVEDAMVLMTERRLRRLPVCDHGSLVGIISIGDLTKWAVRENAHLKSYIWPQYPG
jgi:CBS domain-containing protein